jgi:hypothetical protein
MARMNNETCKTRKQKFMHAVQILAPGDQLIFQAAQRIPEEKLPAFPGGAALEFVAALHKLRETASISLPIKPKAHPARDAGHQKPAPHPATSINGRRSRCHALWVKSAEYWLRLGEADQALRELEKLPQTAWNHPAVVKARVAALEALRQRTEAIVQN